MNLAVGIYAVLLFIGGVIGYLSKGSLASLIMGAVFGLAFAVLSFQKGRIAYAITVGLTLVLLVFFAYRFSLAFKIMPAGLMSLMSLALLIMLAQNCPSSACCESDKDKCSTSLDHKKQ